MTRARGGSSPKVDRVSFERSLDDGATWTSLGAGSRIGGTDDWQLSGLVLPGAKLGKMKGKIVELRLVPKSEQSEGISQNFNQSQ